MQQLHLLALRQVAQRRIAAGGAGGGGPVRGAEILVPVEGGSDAARLDLLGVGHLGW